MVCTFGRGRMACMVRLLEAGSFPEKSAEEATHERIAIQTICRQFYDADESNLLEEKDMHVFDSRPLRDPLHLVCCNDCRKPVKASQFAWHAEHCRLINSKEDAVLELDTGTDRKKPPKKGRRIQATNGMATPVGRGAIPDASAVCSGVSGIPGPLATKIYHLRGSHRLRTALAHLYQQTSVKEHGRDSIFVQHHRENALSSRVPYGNQSLDEIHGENVSQTKVCGSFPNSVLNFLWGPQEDYYHISGFKRNPMRTLFYHPSSCSQSSRKDEEQLSFSIIFIFQKNQIQLLAPCNSQIKALRWGSCLYVF